MTKYIPDSYASLYTGTLARYRECASYIDEGVLLIDEPNEKKRRTVDRQIDFTRGKQYRYKVNKVTPYFWSVDAELRAAEGETSVRYKHGDRKEVMRPQRNILAGIGYMAMYSALGTFTMPALLCLVSSELVFQPALQFESFETVEVDDELVICLIANVLGPSGISEIHIEPRTMTIRKTVRIFNFPVNETHSRGPVSTITETYRNIRID